MDEIQNAGDVKESKQQNTIKEIIYSLKPIILIENLFGINRFDVVNNKLVPVRTITKIRCFFTCALYLAASYSIYRGLIELDDNASIAEILDLVPSIVVIIQYIACVVASLLLVGDTTRKIINTFADLDFKLRININEDFYKKSRNYVIKALIIFIIIHSACSATDIIVDPLTNDNLPGKFVLYVMYVEQDIEVLVFCEMVFMLKRRLIAINEYLSAFIREKDENKAPIFIVTEKEVASEKQFNFIGRISGQNMKIRDLAAMYDTIGDICFLINDVFRFQIFMNLVSTFTFVVITIWSTIYYYRSPGNVSEPIINVVTWCLLTILSVAVICFTCESLLTVRNNTKLLVNEIIMDYDLPKTMRVQAKVFMELIEAWPLKMFVYDMFSIDIKLMLKFISVATTYLIAIIQLSHFV